MMKPANPGEAIGYEYAEAWLTSKHNKPDRSKYTNISTSS